MSTTSPILGLPLPDDDSPNDPPIHFAGFSGVLDSRGVQRFASATARDTAYAAMVSAGHPMEDGMQCYVTGSGRQQYVSGNWRFLDLQVLSTLAARDAAFPSPIRGDQCLCLGTLMSHNGTKWRFTLSGTATVASDANGFITFPHGGGQAPTGWVIVPGYQSTDAANQFVQILASSNAPDATFLGCRATRTDGNGYLINFGVTVTWMAQF